MSEDNFECIFMYFEPKGYIQPGKSIEFEFKKSEGRKMSDRAIVLPGVCSIPEAYLIGRKRQKEEDITEFLEDLTSIPMYQFGIKLYILNLKEKWEAKKDEI